MKNLRYIYIFETTYLPASLHVSLPPFSSYLYFSISFHLYVTWFFNINYLPIYLFTSLPTSYLIYLLIFLLNNLPAFLIPITTYIYLPTEFLPTYPHIYFSIYLLTFLINYLPNFFIYLFTHLPTPLPTYLLSYLPN